MIESVVNIVPSQLPSCIEVNGESRRYLLTAMLLFQRDCDMLESSVPAPIL